MEVNYSETSYRASCLRGVVNILLSVWIENLPIETEKYLKKTAYWRFFLCPIFDQNDCILYNILKGVYLWKSS